MGKFARLIDKLVTIWIILVDMIVGLILSAFTVAVMFQDLYYYDKLWNNMGLAVASLVIVNAVNFGIKVFLRSFKK